VPTIWYKFVLKRPQLCADLEVQLCPFLLVYTAAVLNHMLTGTHTVHAVPLLLSTSSTPSCQRRKSERRKRQPCLPQPPTQPDHPKSQTKIPDQYPPKAAPHSRAQPSPLPLHKQPRPPPQAPRSCGAQQPLCPSWPTTIAFQRPRDLEDKVANCGDLAQDAGWPKKRGRTDCSA
jgi:hypothetical protein